MHCWHCYIKVFAIAYSIVNLVRKWQNILNGIHLPCLDLYSHDLRAQQRGWPTPLGRPARRLQDVHQTREHRRFTHIQPLDPLHQGFHPAVLSPLPLRLGLPTHHLLHHVRGRGLLPSTGLCMVVSLPPDRAILGPHHPRNVYWGRPLSGKRGPERGDGYRHPSFAHMACLAAEAADEAEDGRDGHFDGWWIVSLPMFFCVRTCVSLTALSVCAVSIVRLQAIVSGLRDPDITWHYVENLVWW